MFYKCLRCGEVLPSFATGLAHCRCRNIRIDGRHGKVAIEDASRARLFSDTGGNKHPLLAYTGRLFSLGALLFLVSGVFVHVVAVYVALAVCAVIASACFYLERRLPTRPVR